MGYGMHLAYYVPVVRCVTPPRMLPMPAYNRTCKLKSNLERARAADPFGTRTPDHSTTCERISAASPWSTKVLPPRNNSACQPASPLSHTRPAEAHYLGTWRCHTTPLPLPLPLPPPPIGKGKNTVPVYSCASSPNSTGSCTPLAVPSSHPARSPSSDRCCGKPGQGMNDSIIALPDLTL